MGNFYLVPASILIKQARDTVTAYRMDTPNHRAQLSDIGLTNERIESLKVVVEKLGDLLAEDDEEEPAQPAPEQVIPALKALISWRQNTVLPRVKIALDRDPLLRRFRPGHLRSHRAAAIIQEARLLVGAIEQHLDVPSLQERGVDETMAQRGRDLIRFAAGDQGAAPFPGTDPDVSERFFQLTDQVDELLAEIERCAGAVFSSDKAAIARYRMAVIRNYVAEMHNRVREDGLVIDPTSEIRVSDPW